MKYAYQMHATPSISEKADIIITNSYPQANKGVPWWCAIDSLREGGSAVGIHQFPLGNDGLHSFLEDRDWWNRIQGYPHRPWPVPQAGQIIIFDPHPTKWDTLQVNENVRFISSWDHTLKRLVSFHGEDATVAVYPNAKLQFDPNMNPLIL